MFADYISVCSLQSKALIRLQSAKDPDTQRRCLTCYLLPQQRMDPIEAYGDDNQSFHPSLWEEQRQQRSQIQFQDTGQKDAVNVSAPLGCIGSVTALDCVILV